MTDFIAEDATDVANTALSTVSNVAKMLETIEGVSSNLDPRTPSSDVLPTGFQPLDRLLDGGIRQHDLFVVAGRPGVGKTIFTLQMARNLALGGATVVFACYEHHPDALLGRLLALEVGSLNVHEQDKYRVDDQNSSLRELLSGRVHPTAWSNRLLRAARARLDEYASRLHFVRATPSATGLDELRHIVNSVRSGSTLLFVDYLQKVRPARESTTHLEHVAQVTAGLKQASLESAFSVVAVGAISAPGLLRRRIHLAHLDAAVAVGYDSDVVLLLNDKNSIVSANRMAYTLEQADNLRRRVVFTVEKNRSGMAPLNVEFVKDFEHFRFDPVGSYVPEQLIEDGEHDDFRS